MLNMAVRNTSKLIREMSHTQNIRIGRFFTKKAEASLLSSMLSLPEAEELSLLDAGAGTGILSAAAIEKICLAGKTARIRLTCYENDDMMLPMLRNNLERLRKRARRLYGVRLFINILENDFMTDDAQDCFDLAILNPPSRLIAKDAPEMQSFTNVCSGETDLEFLFTLKALRRLKEGGQLAVMLSTDLAAGVYVEKIRKALLSEASLVSLLVADNSVRDEKKLGKMAASAPPFSKHMALCLARGKEQGAISISSVTPTGILQNFRPFEPQFIIRGEQKAILLLRSREEEEVIRFVEKQKETLASLGLKMRTGLTLSSKYADSLRAKPSADTVPLLHPRGVQKGRIAFPLNEGRDYLVPATPALRQPNKNLLLIKRVPTKKDGKHIVCAVYHASQMPRTPYISTDNKLNFIDYADARREMSVPFMTGLFAVLSSSLYDLYLTILSGTRRINASDYASIPLPSEKIIIEIGSRLALCPVFDDRSINATVTTVFRKYQSSFM